MEGVTSTPLTDRVNIPFIETSPFVIFRGEAIKTTTPTTGPWTSSFANSYSCSSPFPKLQLQMLTDWHCNGRRLMWCMEQLSFPWTKPICLLMMKLRDMLVRWGWELEESFLHSQQFFCSSWSWHSYLIE